MLFRSAIEQRAHAAGKDETGLRVLARERGRRGHAFSRVGERDVVARGRNDRVEGAAKHDDAGRRAAAVDLNRRPRAWRPNEGQRVRAIFDEIRGERNE